MHVNMFRRVTLTEDVGTLEMMKRNFDFSSDRRGIGGAQLSLVRISEFEVHLLPNVEVCGAASRAVDKAMRVPPRPSTPPCYAATAACLWFSSAGAAAEAFPGRSAWHRLSAQARLG
jgi:hypothetical protein